LYISDNLNSHDLYTKTYTLNKNRNA